MSSPALSRTLNEGSCESNKGINFRNCIPGTDAGFTKLTSVETWEEVFAMAHLPLPPCLLQGLLEATRTRRKSRFEWITADDGLLNMVRCLSAACGVFHSNLLQHRCADR